MCDLIAVITGPSEGTIGGQTAIDLAGASPAEIILAGRTIANIRSVMDAVSSASPSTHVSFVQLDLADLSSVREAARKISSKIDKLDVLINNAGSKSNWG